MRTSTKRVVFGPRKTLRFAGNRFRFPTKQVAATAAGNNLAVIAEFQSYTPSGYSVRDLQFAFPWYWTNINGVASAETAVGNSGNVYFSVQVGNGPWRLGKINGASPATLADNSNNISDAGLIPEWLSPSTKYTVRVIAGVSDVQNRAGGMRTISAGGNTEGVPRRSATVADLTPLLTNGAALSTSGGTSANVTGIDLDIYGPAWVVGWTLGSPRSILIGGDSIAYSRNSILTQGNARGSQGFLQIGFENAGWGCATMAIQGIKLQFEQVAGGTSSWILRPASFDALPMLPFDSYITDAGRNDIATAIATVQGWMTAHVAKVKAKWPSVRVGFVTPPPAVNSGGTYTTLVGQTVATGGNYPGDTEWGLRTWCMALNSGLDFCYDASPLFWADGNPTGGDPRDKWRYDQAMTVDGTHPETVMHELAAVSLTNAALAGGF